MPTVKLRIGPADDGRRMTLEDFHEADEQPGYLYELSRGLLEVTEVPGDDHGQILDNLHEALSKYRAEHPGLIQRFAHGSDVRFILVELESDRHPDLAVIFRDFARMYRNRQRPDLAVEIVSSGRRARERDYEEKAEEYLALGLREYWIVDPQERHVVVLSRTEEAGRPCWSERRFSGDDPIESGLPPGFAMAVAQLWVDTEENQA